MFDLSARVWVSIFNTPKLSSRGQTLGAKSAKKCCHVGTLEAFHLWSLATSVKAQRSTSRSPPMTLLDFLHLSIDRPSVKTPLVSANELNQSQFILQIDRHIVCRGPTLDPHICNLTFSPWLDTSKSEAVPCGSSARSNGHRPWRREIYSIT